MGRKRQAVRTLLGDAGVGGESGESPRILGTLTLNRTPISFSYCDIRRRLVAWIPPSQASRSSDTRNHPPPWPYLLLTSR